MYEPIDSSFFNVPVLELARNLVGQYIVHEQPEGLSVVRIVETEAYHGAEDRAAHSYGNRRTKRTEVMFGRPGSVYTYQMHTHTLMNVVCAQEGTPHAVLLRAGEPIEGVSHMQQRRGIHIKKETDLTNGPGKLSKALGVTMSYYGHHWTQRPLYIAEGFPQAEIEAGPRVGIGNTGEAVHYPWRFYEKDNPFVSKYRK